MGAKMLRQIRSELLDMFPVTPPTRHALLSGLIVIMLLSCTPPTGAQITTSDNTNKLTVTDISPELTIHGSQTLHSQHDSMETDTNVKYSELTVTPPHSQEHSNVINTNNNKLIFANDKVLKRTHIHRRRNNRRELVHHAHHRKRRKHVSNFRQSDDEDVHDDRRYVTREGSRVSRGGGKHEKRRLPKALIIGAKKGGTRALLEFLRMHPDVKAPGPEIHYFDKHYSRGQQWYRNQMPSTTSGQLTIEKTPSYMVSKDVPSRIYRMSNQTRLIVVLRDPVTRAISDYTQTASKFPGTKSFEDFAFLDNSTGAVDTSWSALRIGIYAIHLSRWLDYFPLSQIHFVSGERLITDPAREIARVQEFLGLEPLITEKHFLLDTEKGFPCLRKHADSGRPHCLGKTKGRIHPDVPPRLLKRLRDFYRPFNIKLYKMVGQDFGWE